MLAYLLNHSLAYLLTVGEAELNLKTLYSRIEHKKSAQKVERMWVSCTHPNFKGVQARVCLTIEVMTLAESIRAPAGKGRDAPNENPHLDMPVRPGLFDGLGFNINFFNPFAMFRKYFIRCCCCLIIVAVIAIVVFLQVSG